MEYVIVGFLVILVVLYIKINDQDLKNDMKSLGETVKVPQPQSQRDSEYSKGYNAGKKQGAKWPLNSRMSDAYMDGFSDSQKNK